MNLFSGSNLLSRHAGFCCTWQTTDKQTSPLELSSGQAQGLSSFSATGDAGEMLLVPPSHSMAKTSGPYWSVHFVDSEGLDPPDDLEDLTTFILAWQHVMSLKSKVRPVQFF